MTTIEMHESILGEFAHRGDAKQVAQLLEGMGWKVTLVGEDAPPGADALRWQFDSLADYRRFQRDFELVRDNLSRAGRLRVAWACDCEDDDSFEPCPHGDDPVAQARGGQRAGL